MTIANYSGIYKITNNLNGKIYVGQSENVYKRKAQHFLALRRHKHENKQMQKDWNTNNAGFRFDVIEWCEISKLNEREKYWIETLHSYQPRGYNAGWVPYKRKALTKKKKTVKGYHKTIRERGNR